jgi:hypothetical protein
MENKGENGTLRVRLRGIVVPTPGNSSPAFWPGRERRSTGLPYRIGSYGEKGVVWYGARASTVGLVLFILVGGKDLDLDSFRPMRSSLRFIRDLSITGLARGFSSSS